MTSTSKAVLAGLSGVVVLLAVSIWYFGTNNQDITLWGFPVSVVQVGDRAGRFLHEADGVRLSVTRITGIEQAAAEQLIKEKIIQFGSLFEKARVGYKGQHTEFVECDERYKPALTSMDLGEGRLRFFRGYANDRFVPGACDEDSIDFHFVVALLYCRSARMLYDAEYFAALARSAAVEAFLKRITCEQDQ